MQINMEKHLRCPKLLPMFGQLKQKSLIQWMIVLIVALSPPVRAEIKTNNMTTEKQKLEIFAKLHRSLSNGIRSAKSIAPREWIEAHKLNIESTGACFNSGQIHHRKEQSFKDELASIGFLTQSDVPTNNGQIPYTVFGNYSILFPLKNQNHQVVNFYAISIKNGKTEFLNKEGIYPCYPNEQTRKLYIVPNVIDAATLLSTNILDNKETVIALHNGILLPQHEEAIKKLTQLQEIIWIENNKN